MNSSKKIKVLIVDDSLFIRQLFTDGLSQEPDIEVVGSACDPYEAREKIKQYNPDVITLDIEMPKMDGLSFLEKIMSLRPMPVIMCSSLTQKGAEQTLHALEMGAFDYVSKMSFNNNPNSAELLIRELVNKIRAAAHSSPLRRKIATQSPPKALSFKRPSGAKAINLIAIGASTGGVEALREVFLRLPANLPPIVITQHMPETFTKSFAERLNKLSEVTVLEAANHARLEIGHAYIAPGGHRHLKIMRIANHYVCRLEEGEPVSSHRPSVDVLFHSVAEAAQSSALGVILTGMGKDGAHGMKEMHDAGAYTIGQNQESCVVYGMPHMAYKAGGVSVELALEDIPKAIVHQCEKA